MIRIQTLHTNITQKQQAEFDSLFRKFKPAQAVYFFSDNQRMDKWILGTIVTRRSSLRDRQLWQIF